MVDTLRGTDCNDFHKISVILMEKIRMVAHGQLVEPAVCLSDLCDVFLLDIV